ncbi:hypothetical protein AX16_005853 [Volvariella volvacea WC 439]|nr:hypothetical protein AX16_005853 [Volvariella volvacea WC 439]
MVLGDCILWGEIREPFLKLMPILLERSGMAPLSISLRWMEECSDELIDRTLELVAKHHNRVQHLSLDLEYTDDEIAVLWKSAPILTYCQFFDGGIVLPPNRTLFNGSAPRLTALELEKVEFSWDLPVLRSMPMLKELKVSYPGSRPTQRELWEILSSMPNLEDLNLCEALPIPGDVTPSIVALAHLRGFVLRGTSLECSSFLCWVSHEKATSFSVSCSDAPQDGAHHTLQPHISRLCNQHDSWGPMRYLIFEYYPNDYVELESCYSIHIEFTNRGDEIWPPVFWFQWDFPQDDDALPSDFIQMLFQSLPVLGCKEFISYFPLTSTDWAQCANNMLQLEDLRLKALDPQLSPFTLLPLLDLIIASGASSTRPDSLDSMDRHTPFPKLESIEVEGNAVKHYLEKFLRMLEVRKDQNCRLKKVTVQTNGKWGQEYSRELKTRVEKQGLVERFIVWGLRDGGDLDS